MKDEEIRELPNIELGASDDETKDVSVPATDSETVEQPVGTTPAATPVPAVDPKVSPSDLLGAILAGYGEGGSDAGKTESHSVIRRYLNQIADSVACADKYNIVCLYDNSTMLKADADRVYSAVTQFTDSKPLLLMLYSNGGVAGSAYLIGKLCMEYSKGRFAVTVPRMAKSAATLICCAANEIHMGSLSELGPIDPQINDLPALGLKNAVDHIAELVKKYPDSSEMFSKYLASSLPLINLGYYERVAESAVQYAEKLMSPHASLLPRSAKTIAHELVYGYKDHTFVIDKSEAEGIFGEQIVKQNTAEYELGNSLYRGFDVIRTFAQIVNHTFYFIGSLDMPGVFLKRSS